MRTAIAPQPARHTANVQSLARRWYYTPKSRRAYSVRQISPGDRRLLAEFVLALNGNGDRDAVALSTLTDMLFDRVLAGGSDLATGFVALEGTAAGDRIIGVAACAPANAAGETAAALDHARFGIAVAAGYREEQVGRILMATLIRHAKRVGVRCLTGDMLWSNRPMQLLAQSMGFAVEAIEGDRQQRRLVLSLK
jgi:GNAT superfamily N-acetyltransferase